MRRVDFPIWAIQAAKDWVDVCRRFGMPDLESVYENGLNEIGIEYISNVKAW